MSKENPIDVGMAIENQSAGSFSFLILVLCCAAMVIEGYDVQVLAYAAPRLFAIGKSNRPISAPCLERRYSATCWVQP